MDRAAEYATLFTKAHESLLGAESELANRRFQNAANRAYYAVYQAAVAALVSRGVTLAARRWTHENVQALFVGELINRRKFYPPEFRDVFERLTASRNVADYHLQFVAEIQAARAVRRARQFVELVTQTEELGK